MNIGIVGYGVVGKATANGLKKAGSLFIHDKYKHNTLPLSSLSLCDLIFICLPTPMKTNGAIDLSIIYSTIKELSKDFGNIRTIVIRSTVMIGTIRDLSKEYKNINFVFNPEFLTDRNADKDFLTSCRIVIGSDNLVGYKMVKKVYELAGFSCPLLRMNSISAEALKYCSNIFLASQVSIANELYEVCKISGIRWDTIRNALTYDERIGKFINVPGNDGDRGFGGKCFPKDLNALIHYSKTKGYNAKLLKEIWRTNLRFRNNIDWQTTKKG